MSFVDFLFFAGAGVVLLALERLLPMHTEQKTLRSGWKIDLVHVFLTGTLIRIGATFTILAASMFAISLAPDSIRQAVRDQPDWLEFVELLLLSDLFIYLIHRTCHAVPFLWRFHAVHHSSEQLDWLATYRVHPFDQILNSTVIALPALVLGFSPIPLFIYAVIYRVHAPLLHSNTRFSFGPLGLLFTSPRFHHWHHADEIEAHDHNFGGQLTIFDRLFGTYYQRTESSLPTRYGVGGAIPLTYGGHMLQPFRTISRVGETVKA